MAHIHSVYDTDSHFSINPITRTIKNESSNKNLLIQHDHNAERFTFEIPRYIEEHDMSEVTKAEIHYVNIDAATKAQSTGLYEVDDLQICPGEDNIVILSWLISGNATKYVGSLNFIVRFVCLTGSTIDYAWHSGVYSGITVGKGINNTEEVATEYADVLEQWRLEFDEKYVELEGFENELNTLRAADKKLSAEIAAIRGTVGQPYTKNLLKNTMLSQTIGGITFTVNEDGSVTANGTATLNVALAVYGGIFPESLKYNEVILSGCPEGGSEQTYYMKMQRTCSTGIGYTEFAFDYGGGSGSVDAYPYAAKNLSVYIRIANGFVADNLTFYPMIRYAEIEDDTYEPYVPNLQDQIDELRSQIAAMTAAAATETEE